MYHFEDRIIISYVLFPFLNRLNDNTSFYLTYNARYLVKIRFMRGLAPYFDIGSVKRSASCVSIEKLKSRSHAYNSKNNQSVDKQTVLFVMISVIVQCI